VLEHIHGLLQLLARRADPSVVVLACSIENRKVDAAAVEMEQEFELVVLLAVEAIQPFDCARYGRI
jgi:hypothetical protein